MRVGLQKTSLVNYPDRVAAAVFLPGCNLRCPYCYNGALACGQPDDAYVPIETVYEHIEKRKKVLSGFVISGGEALLSPELPALISAAKQAGLAVKLDTNGLLPEALARVLHNPELCPDMLAVDIKTNPDRYSELGFCSRGSAGAALKETLRMLRQKDDRRQAVAVEYRTVLVPPLVQASDIATIAELLPHEAEWVFAPFLPGNCLDPAWNDIRPYTLEEMHRLVAYARTKVPASRLR